MKTWLYITASLVLFILLFLSDASHVYAAACSYPLSEAQDTLRNDASQKGLLIGAIGNYYPEFIPIAEREFSVMIADDSMALEEPNGPGKPGDFTASYTQSILNRFNNMSFKVGDLVSRHANPSWLTGDPTIYKDVHDYWDHIFARDNPNVIEYEVINEDQEHTSDPTYSTAGPYSDTYGEWTAFTEAYTYARQKVPGKLLSLNDTWPNQGMVTFASQLKASGVPIDVLSIEMHLGSFTTVDMNKMVGYMDTFMNAAQTAGFKVEISEASAASDGSTSQNNQQAANYNALVATCLRHSNCFEILFWSTYDAYASYDKNSSLFDANLNRKPAYYGVMNAIRNDTTRACVDNTLTPTPTPTPTLTPSCKPGDLNCDGKVDIFDYNILVAKFGNPYTIFDYNNLVGNFGK